MLFFQLVNSLGKNMTGSQLLEKAIEYHDPNGNWATFSGTFNVTDENPLLNQTGIR